MDSSYTFEPVVHSSARRHRVLLLGKTLHDGGEALRNSDWFEIHVSPKALGAAKLLTARHGADTAEDSGH